MRPKKYKNPVYVNFQIEQKDFAKMQEIGKNFGNTSELIRKAIMREIALFEKREKEFDLELYKQMNDDAN